MPFISILSIAILISLFTSSASILSEADAKRYQGICTINGTSVSCLTALFSSFNFNHRGSWYLDDISNPSKLLTFCNVASSRAPKARDEVAMMKRGDCAFDVKAKVYKY